MARTGRVGVWLHEPDVRSQLAAVELAERCGVPGAWFKTGSLMPDPLTLAAVAASRTERIVLGTAVVLTFPRHPLALAQQALVMAAIAPGRLRLGVGPSHRSTMEETYGLPFERPLEHLREYVTVLKQALHEARFEHHGTRFRVRGAMRAPSAVPVLMSALGPGAFRLAGEVSDGALPTNCPLPYLRDLALPAMDEGAARAGRQRPPLIAHCWVAFDADAAAVRTKVQAIMGWTVRTPFYQEMYARAGFPEAREGRLSDRLADAIIVAGDEDVVAAGLSAYLDAGVDEVTVSLVDVDGDHQASLKRMLTLVGAL